MIKALFSMFCVGFTTALVGVFVSAMMPTTSGDTHGIVVFLAIVILTAGGAIVTAVTDGREP